MSLLTLVHTCKLYEESRAKLINETWANGLDDFFFVCDSDDFSLPRAINLGPYLPGPTYHPETLMKIFRLFKSRKFRNYSWLFLVDDDSYVFPDKLKNLLQFFDFRDPLMMGDFLNWPTYNSTHKGDYLSWVAGGPGIVFSRAAVDLLVGYAKRVPTKYIAHDVWLHNLMVAEGSWEIKRVHAPGFHQYGAEELYKKFDRDSNALISIHLGRDMSLINRYHERARPMG